MNIYLAFGIILLLLVIILFLSIALHHIIKKATYLSEKQKEFIIFAIDMYIQYAEELDIVSPDKHEQLVKQLESIKEKYLK